ncbi:MAG: AMP-binding protein [Planctomycetaceae bacterium]
MTRDALQRRQWERLRTLLHEVGRSNPFWQQKYREAGVDLSAVRSLEDLSLLPFSTKHELVADQNAHPPFGSNLTYPRAEYTRLHQTSGTTGRPMRWLDTPASWDWFMSCWGQIYRIAGVTPADVMAFPFSFGPFIGFWAGFEGACRLGNLTLAMGGMTSEARLRLMLDLEATFICCTPTYAMRLVEVAEKEGVNLADSSVRGVIVAGEPGGNLPSVRQRIETAWGARVFDHWGMTDIGSLGIEPVDAPGGMTLLETECIAEVIDPQTCQPVPRGQLGELVITNLGRVGQPVIRYRTGDLVKVSTTPCPSGMEMIRLDGGIIGRADDMVTIRGNNVFPSSLDAILREFEQVAEYRITLQTRRSMPHLRVEIEPEATTAHVTTDVELLVDQVSRTIKDRLNFQAEVVPTLPGSLPRFELKGRRFVKETS